MIAGFFGLGVGVTGLLFIGGGIWMISIGRGEMRRMHMLDSAVATSAQIVGTRSERSGDDLKLWVRLRFQADSGQAVDKETEVSSPFFKKAREGGYTRVKHHPSNPEDFLIVEDRTARWQPHLFIIFGAVLVLAGLGAGLFGLIALPTLLNTL